MKWVCWLVMWVPLVASAALNSRELTADYCSKAAITEPRGREGVFRFLSGVEEAGLLPNLVDFAFFCADQNVPFGAPVSLANTGVVVGTMNRLRGGYAFENSISNNGLYFTNLPPTPSGRSILVWGSEALHKNISNNVNDVVFELTGSGGPLPTPNPVMSFVYLGGSNPNPHVYNGAPQVIGPVPGVASGNSIFALAIASGPDGVDFVVKKDYPAATWVYSVTNPVINSPNVLRFAIRNALGNTTCGWPGLIRGFCYFNKVLTTNEILFLDRLVPRVGVVFEGDSKTIGVPWPTFYCEASQTWGIYSTLTNSAVNGTVVSSANAPGSMEVRWPANSVFRTNAQFPRVFYSLRGGHNDFSGPGIAQPANITNAFKAITNLWAVARSNGCTTLGWTIDRTGTTWSAGNSNLLVLLNGWIREHSSEGDYLMDAEEWFTTQFGPTPFTNYSIYSYSPGNTVHETLFGAELLGRGTGELEAPGLPEPPFSLGALGPCDDCSSGYALEVRGAPGGRSVDVYTSPDLVNWSVLTNITPCAGWAQFADTSSTNSRQRYYRAVTVEKPGL